MKTSGPGTASGSWAATAGACRVRQHEQRDMPSPSRFRLTGQHTRARARLETDQGRWPVPGGDHVGVSHSPSPHDLVRCEWESFSRTFAFSHRNCQVAGVRGLWAMGRAILYLIGTRREDSGPGCLASVCG